VTALGWYRPPPRRTPGADTRRRAAGRPGPARARRARAGRGRAPVEVEHGEQRVDMERVVPQQAGERVGVVRGLRLLEQRLHRLRGPPPPASRRAPAPPRTARASTPAGRAARDAASPARPPGRPARAAGAQLATHSNTASMHSMHQHAVRAAPGSTAGGGWDARQVAGRVRVAEQRRAVGRVPSRLEREAAVGRRPGVARRHKQAAPQRHAPQHAARDKSPHAPVAARRAAACGRRQARALSAARAVGLEIGASRVPGANPVRAGSASTGRSAAKRCARRFARQAAQRLRGGRAPWPSSRPSAAATRRPKMRSSSASARSRRASSASSGGAGAGAGAPAAGRAPAACAAPRRCRAIQPAELRETPGERSRQTMCSLRRSGVLSGPGRDAGAGAGQAVTRACLLLQLELSQQLVQVVLGANCRRVRRAGLGASRLAGALLFPLGPARGRRGGRTRRRGRAALLLLLVLLARRPRLPVLAAAQGARRRVGGCACAARLPPCSLCRRADIRQREPALQPPGWLTARLHRGHSSSRGAPRTSSSLSRSKGLNGAGAAAGLPSSSSDALSAAAAAGAGVLASLKRCRCLAAILGQVTEVR